jgi:Zn-dependent protease
LILAEPPRTQYDIRFVLAGVPVRIHPLFWLVSLILGLPRNREMVEGAPRAAVIVLIWMAVVFVSILIHEMGHAFAIRYYGWRPRVVLWQLGGLAIWDSEASYGYQYNRNDDNAWAKIIIAAAGPAAGFVFAALVVAVCYATRHAVTFSLGGPLGFDWHFDGFTNMKTVYLVNNLLYVNIFWGLINLLPVFPLDGGQISRELFTMSSRSDGVQKSLMLSAITGAVVAILALTQLGFGDGLFPAVMFGYLAYVSYSTLQAYRGGGYGDYDHDDRGW